MSPAATRYLITVHQPAERFLALVEESEGELVAWGSAGLDVWTSAPGQRQVAQHRRTGR
jgi:hypothetical protein